ncbi:MAG: PilW family protein [Crocosphaera sp.]
MLKIYLKLLQKSPPAGGWTLVELMIAAVMTLVVLMVSGFGLMTILKENKVANATGAMQYELNRATEFISEEIRTAKTIETNIDDIKLSAPTFFSKHPDKTPILALKIDGIYERVIYYIDEVDDARVWRGPGEIKRFGPGFYGNGTHKHPDEPENVDKDKGRKPSKWRSLTLVDMMVLDLDDERKDCRNLIRDPTEEGIYNDSEGNQWFRFPKATADVKGFFSCVREDKQLAQFNLVGTTLDEFQHLGYEKEGIRSKESRHADKMEYEVISIAHARSELSGGNGQDIPGFRVNPDITFKEPGHATIDVVYANIPCHDNTTSDEVTTVFYTKAEGQVDGANRGSVVRFDKNEKANPHIKEMRSGGCSSENMQYEINARVTDNVKYATNDTSNHTKLNDIVPSSSDNFQEIVNQLNSKDLIKKGEGDTYNFFLPDNKVLYFVEFEFFTTTPENIDPVTLEIISFQKQKDSPNFDDAVILVEVNETK